MTYTQIFDLYMHAVDIILLFDYCTKIKLHACSPGGSAVSRSAITDVYLQSLLQSTV